ncbi:UvrD-helicase domain-containing protein [Gluconacetobacter sacchari]|uniref:AAA family ATPase n=2 Tax=Gluconacetobacter sacchari TaxID=92759 RepID=A0A7W4NLB5_9PROT|nr:UvrD-helicase domain-containing protein [Gluconacetobacter sacchari]MBB2159881.1 AAA family ATPase [Gluconacetobacter sacchari]GBQ26917.1 ankyrin [Gluconacetobacter sacchari DSM 12717]
MDVLTYAGFDPGKWRKKLDKLVEAIGRDDFRSADLKKLAPTTYYRLKLDDASRVLVRFVRHRDRTVCLVLEIIEHHAYDKSRFLRGAKIDESRIEEATPAQARDEAEPVRYLHPGRAAFHMLDKPLSFDDAQEAIYRQHPPLIIVGAAGSGKTALTLEKLRQAEGEVLYVTLSPWLARNARDLYHAHGYENPAQEAQFLSFREFLETLRVPSGREVDFATFQGWFARHRQQYRFTEAHPCFEEFRGVIGSRPDGVLGREAYLALGPRQSIYEPDQRGAIHDLFGKYRSWLKENDLFDSNLIAHEWRQLAEPRYDFVVIDEVQDLTSAQLALILRTLRTPGHFLLCGDSNQIVHPNFFSWSAVKSLFWADPALAERQTLAVLDANYRNTSEITRVANTLLKIKQARFGSVDRESNHLVRSVADAAGEARLLPDKDAVLRDLDARTRASTRFAVLVLRDEDKEAARAVFHTPLVFSVHEAKGLEYPNIILYRFISGQRGAFAEICDGVDAASLERDTLDYRRAKDKHDRSLELWKFYVNALYVAITRAVERLYVIESDQAHPLLRLLDIRAHGDELDMQAAKSSREEWEREAQRLALQGKQEQATAIRQSILKDRPVPWPVWNEELLRATMRQAYDPKQVSTKPRQLLMDFAIWHHAENHIEAMVEQGWPNAIQLLRRWRDGSADRARQSLKTRYFGLYDRNVKDVLFQCDQYGVDHRNVADATPLMFAVEAGNVPLVEALLDRGADIAQRDLFGQTAQSYALARAARDADYAQGPFARVYPLVALPDLDVEVDGRLVRLGAHQGEYLLFQLMLAGLKTLASLSYNDDISDVSRRAGFDAAYLMRNIAHFPRAIWHEDRRKRVYFNGVLARAEIGSSYAPARKLWLRMRNGNYLPNPALRLRVRTRAGEEQWQPIYHVLNLAMVEQGNGRGPGRLGPAYRFLLEQAGIAPAPPPPEIY